VKEKVALVIAVLMLISMAFVISTTTVSAPSTFSASPGATLSPTSARANTRIKFTVTVTNDYTGDNIDNVQLMSPGFSQPIGYAENLVKAGDNIENAVAHLRQAGENMKKAEDNKKSAGPDVKYTGDNLQAPTQDDWRSAAVVSVTGSSAAADNAWIKVESAGSNLVLAADAIDNQIENLDYIRIYMDNAGAELIYAAGRASAMNADNIENFHATAADNVRQAGENLRSAAGSIRFGDLETAGLRLLDAGVNLVAAGALLDDLDLELAAVGSAGSALQTAGNKLNDAGNFLDNAGYALDVAENYLRSVGLLLENVTNLRTAAENLKKAASWFENAGIALLDNVPRAGENLRSAAGSLENAALELGVALGQDEENAAATDLKQAADNLRTSGKVDITTAGNELISAASNLSAAASKMKSTASDLQPTTWSISTITDGVRFDAIGDNIIAPGASRTFVFLWTTPNITTKADYMISVLVSKEEPVYTAYENLGGFTVTIDGKKPTVIINVTQVGVTAVNVVGTALDSARATITITASETLLSLENVYVENYENFRPPITMTTTDNIVYTGTFTVENWDDNRVVVRVSKIKDLAGNENNTGMENVITVDTRKPIFIDNGLAALLVGVRENVVQAGTGTVFRYVDNSASENMVIIVKDNLVSLTDNNWGVISVTIDTTAATRDPTIDNRWTKSITLSEGLNSIVKVTATDRVGNAKSDNIENIFIDTRAPTIAFSTVAGKTWDENGELISDNTPEIKITVLDPGYPTGGLGVARENLRVEVSNIENFDASVSGTWFQRPLENKAAWSPSTGVFENLIDNAGKGLKDGTYYVRVFAGDNLRHYGRENENAIRSFTIDTIKPVKDTDIVVSDKIGGTLDNPKVYKVADRTIEGTVTSGEVGGTIKFYFNGVHQSTYDILTTATTWSRTVTLPVGQVTKIEVTLTDKAGNESEKVLYGYAMPDATPPTVTITAPETGISTDATSIILKATVTIDAWEEYSEITVRVDATSLTAPLTATNVLSEAGELTRAVELVEGTNTISVSAQDVAGNWSTVKTVTVTRTVTPWATYAIIIVIVALILAAIAIFRKR